MRRTVETFSYHDNNTDKAAPTPLKSFSRGVFEICRAGRDRASRLLRRLTKVKIISFNIEWPTCLYLRRRLIAC
ncbi:hypothetical protein CEXT_665311 [Caerostris extrusa]|uniref:Uncharacterized protein n=1 Tax=Caerostris extrusa TaxID=172846 RepID=A0AAV4PGJ6_CAEEX|nr:hypothetical protein CEXT_665311 [Caerostris extrusa]